MKSIIISLTQCSNNHTVITLLNDDTKVTPKYIGRVVYKAYVDKTVDVNLVGKVVEHSRSYRGWVTIKTDINAQSDNK